MNPSVTVTQIFYASSLSKGTDEREIDAILTKAREYNSKNEITGVLLYYAEIFLQLIEGEKAKVETLYQKILSDSRHSNVIRLFDADKNERIYKDWDMGFRKVNDLDIKMVNEILSWNKLISATDRIDNKLIITMLEKFKSVASRLKT